MPPVIPGAPWWANLALLALAVTAPVVITHMSTRRRLEDVKATQERQAKVIAEVHETTVNTHPTILRDDIDRIERKVDSLVDDVGHVQREQARAATYVTDVDVSVRALRHSMERRDRIQTEALASAVADRKREIAKALDTALTQHVADCPARNTYKETP